MPDLKTTAETVRTPITGAELVRLATAGANWQASLTNIFAALGTGGGGGTPGGSNLNVQFNNSGAFGGTADLTWLTGPATRAGLTIGGATISGSTVTPGTGREHMAIGSYGVVDNVTTRPGDVAGVNTGFQSTQLNVNEFVAVSTSSGSTTVAGISNIFGIKCTSTGTSNLSYYGYSDFSSVNSDSTGRVAEFYALFINPLIRGSGIVTTSFAINGVLNTFNSGTTGTMGGLKFGVTSFATGDITTMLGIDVSISHSGAANLSSAYGIRSRITNAAHSTEAYCLYLFDTAGKAASRSYNILSQSAAWTGTLASTIGGNLFQGHSAFGSKSDVSSGYAVFISDSSGGLYSAGPTLDNVIEGYLGMKQTATPPGAVASMARIFAQDNGSGKTQLMVQFPTGAAQQIAIEP